MANYYDVLGVAANASSAEIRQSYLRLAKERHPDRFPDPVQRAAAQDFFKDLTAAFNTLANDRTRREYDESLARPKFTAPEEIARDAFERAARHFEAREYHEAVELLRLAVHHVPGDARYQAALGRALAKNPHWIREAIQAVEMATQLAPRVASHHAELAEMLLAQGLKLRARKVAEAALALDHAEARALRVLDETGPSDPPDPPPASGLRSLLRRKG